jgi:fumarate hydratase subunit alpha
MIREISVKTIEEKVYELCLSACRRLEPPAAEALRRAAEAERSPHGREALRQLVENLRAAEELTLPLCQDTGMAVLFVDVGQDAHISDGALDLAVDEGVRRAWRDGCFRASVLSPLDRANTWDNTPAILHTRLVPGDRVRIAVAPKGFGSENMSRLKMLTPSAGIEGVKEFVLETVRLAGGNPCPPVVVGVGVGGNFEHCAELAKRALLRPVGQPAGDGSVAALEAELLGRINALGIGPMGLGGSITALAVHVETFPTHIAGLPVAVNMQCHCARHAQGEV